MNPEKRPNLETELVDQELIVLDTENQKVHKLNGTAAAVFESCDGSQSVDDIVSWLCDTFDVPRTQVEGDVRQILVVFTENGLLISPDE